MAANNIYLWPGQGAQNNIELRNPLGLSSASLAATIAPVTAAITGRATAKAALAETIAPITATITAKAIAEATLAETIAPITVAATGQVLVQATLSATIDDVALSALAVVTGAVPGPATSGGPWWWPEYVRNRLAEQAAAREALARAGEAFAVIPQPFAEAEAEHIYPIGQAAAFAPLPAARGAAHTLRLIAVLHHTSPVDEEGAALTAAALLLRAA